jgi:uncharacterized protein (DUF3084 family)
VLKSTPSSKLAGTPEAGLSMSAATISVDEFLALEQKVLQTVELIKKEREARTQAESARYEAEAERDAARSEVAELHQKLLAADEKLAAVNEKLTAAGDAQTEIAALHSERDAVRQRVEKMLATMDSLL